MISGILDNSTVCQDSEIITLEMESVVLAMSRQISFSDFCTVILFWDVSIGQHLRSYK